MKLLLRSTLFLLMSWTSLRAQQIPLSPAAHKKILKTISMLWQGTEVQTSAMTITDSQLQGSPLKFGNIQLNVLKKAGEILGYSYIDKVKGKTETFTYVVFFKPDLSVKSVQLLDYSEGYGSEIGSSRWLTQFESKANGEKLEFGKDIKNISGATISARAITEGIKRLTLNMRELRRMGVI